MLLELCNETMYDAVVTVLADDRLKRGLVKHNYFGRMKKVRLPAQGRGNRAAAQTALKRSVFMINLGVIRVWRACGYADGSAVRAAL